MIRAFGYPNGKNGKKDGQMNVLYQQGLEDVARELAAMGYSVHPLRSRVRADAVLYTSDARAALGARAGSGGASVLCVRGMSAGEIARAIERRGCQALF